MREIMQDIRYGLRGFKSNPGFTIASVLAVALGIGATTAIFSVVDRVLLQALPYPKPDRLVSLGIGVAHTDYFDWRARNDVFEEMAMFRGPGPRTLTGVDEATQLKCADVTSSFFKTFRVQPALGRAFTDAEDKPGAPRVILLSDRTWKARFGGARDILGRSLTLNDTPYTVIGVMAPSFRFPGQSVEAITPLAFNTVTKAIYFMPVVGRLKDGVTVGQAAAEIGTFFKAVSHNYGRGEVKLSVMRLQDRQVSNVRLAMLALLGAVGFVLLIACANVANLLLSRSAARQREMAVRAALGAGRMRLLRQLLTESLLLGLTGGAAGILLAALALKSIVHLATNVPRIEDVAIDWRVLGFMLTVSVLVSLLFGIAPAFYAAHTDVNDALKRGAASLTGRNRVLRSTLVVAELALSMALLAGAGLLLETLWKLEHIQTGVVVSEHVLAVDVYLSYKQYPTAQREAFFNDLVARVSGLPGVIAAAATAGMLPPHGPPMTAPIHAGTGAGGEASPGDQVSILDVTPDYFAALGIPVREGRVFTAREHNVAVVNEALARHFFPKEDPVGKQVSPYGTFDHARTIIGVVGDVKNRGVQESVQPELYRLDEDGNIGGLVVRTAGDPLALTSLIREQVHGLDKNTPLEFQTMTEQMDSEFVSQRFNSTLLSSFAGIALLLAAIGIYGVMSYLVTLRTQEIGIRMALGARTNQVLGLVIGDALRLVLAGVAAGAALAVGLTRYLTTLLYGVAPRDAMTLCSVAVLITAVALLASYFPALRASRIDPLTALRHE